MAKPSMTHSSNTTMILPYVFSDNAGSQRATIRVLSWSSCGLNTRRPQHGTIAGVEKSRGGTTASCSCCGCADGDCGRIITFTATSGAEPMAPEPSRLIGVSGCGGGFAVAVVVVEVVDGSPRAVTCVE
ncbi:hypothetical protein Vafri_11868 [Volvox africanus]|uniref:Uncharacterized protein n=1 Tax=Volvox africanus TaxID=51714 RepID=A0A8J4B931_9CHLO|nr:hypothetical protein Vafri_11868 [Volvox africanus]